jgi:hypothetical protein
MNFIFTLNLASGLRTPAEAGANIQQIYAKVDVGSSGELLDLMSKTDFILGREFFIRKKFDNTKWTEDRGDIIIAVPFIGKVKEYFE